MADLTLSHAYLYVGAVDTDPDSPGYLGPAVPGTWRSEFQDAGWYAIFHPSGDRLAAWRANVVGAEGLFALWGPQSILDGLAAAEPRMMPGREAWARKSEAAVRTVLRRWPEWRFDGFIRDGEGNPVAVTDHVGGLFASEGSQIPDPTVTALPWDLDAEGGLTTQAAAVVRVTAIHRPALLHTIAGMACNVTLEDEPGR